ncbi:hypothetical protein B4Q13_17140, partial [Lacticaseibacillus rhamnosus]
MWQPSTRSVVPSTTSAQDVLALKPDGVFLSNGPGDPEPLQQQANEIRRLVGKVPRLRPGSSAQGTVGTLELADGVTVCAGAIVYAGAQIGSGVIIGDHAQVRERAAIGQRTVVGHGSTIDFDVVVGDRVSIQTAVYLTARSVVEDDVFLGPGVFT